MMYIYIFFYSLNGPTISPFLMNIESMESEFMGIAVMFVTPGVIREREARAVQRSRYAI